LLLHLLTNDCTWNQKQGKPAQRKAYRLKKIITEKGLKMLLWQNFNLFRYFLNITQWNHSSACNLSSCNLKIVVTWLYQTANAKII
jgi:hypothetical protein